MAATVRNVSGLDRVGVRALCLLLLVCCGVCVCALAPPQTQAYSLPRAVFHNPPYSFHSIHGSYLNNLPRFGLEHRPSFFGRGGHDPDLDTPLNLKKSGGDGWPYRTLERVRREVRTEQTSESVPEDRVGVLIDLVSKIPALFGRQFELNDTLPPSDIFVLNSAGQISLRAGQALDFEDEDLRTVVFRVHATNPNDPEDVYDVTASLSVTNVDEAPVWVSQPQPYLATIRTNSGAGYAFITLTAKDPEGEPIIYEKNSVSPKSLNNQIELRSITVGSERQCQLRTVGSDQFPEGQTITIDVNARDRSNGGKVTPTSVSVLVGVLPPQFFQLDYEGGMSENNRPQQTVYTLGSIEELKVRYKTFQNGPVSLALMNEDGSDSQYFSIDSSGAIFCLTILDYEAINPKRQSLLLTATQTVGSLELASNVTVTIQIEDTNDNKPLFDRSQYLEEIMENTPVDTSILDVTATDADTGMNAELTYSLIDTDDFYIVTEQNVGIIKVKRILDADRRQGSLYSFKVIATDHGTPSLSSTSNVRVTVTNINDERPEFINAADEEFRVMEDASVGQVIAQIQATDKDGDKVTFSFQSGGQTSGKFRIDRTTGLLTLTQVIADNDDRFTLSILATDDGSCCTGTSTLSNTLQIFVQVYGINQQRPTFTACNSYEPSIFEEAEVGTYVETVSAADSDRGPNGVVTYSITPPVPELAINSSTGVITVNADIDRETTSILQVTVKAKDGGVPSREGWCNFRVNVLDKNDHAPEFDKPIYVANISVDLQPRVSFLAVRAYDKDVGNNARISYTLVDNAGGKFGIITENGFIFLTQQNTESNKQFTLVVMAKDEGSPPLNSTVTVQVNIKPGSSKPPVWDQDYNTRVYLVEETLASGEPVISDMQCNSSIADPRVEFQLVKQDGTVAQRTKFFYIDPQPNSNNITVFTTGEFDYATSTQHIVRIRCVNFGQGVTLVTEQNPTVNLIDTNNQIPQFVGLTDGRYYPEVQENKGPGTSVMTIEATDADETANYKKITFSVVNGGDKFSVEAGTKENTAILRTLLDFDREVKDVYFVTVRAEDSALSVLPQFKGGHNTANVNIRVKITDVNDNEPTFKETLYRLEVNESLDINQLIQPAVEVDDPDESDRGRHTYRITQGNGVPPTFGVRNGLGNLFLLRKLDYESNDKNFNLVLEASDGKYSASTTVTVTVLDVNDNKPVFTPNSYVVSGVVENDNNVPNNILNVTATDADVDRPNQIRYSLQGSSFTVSDYFSIQPNGRLFLNRPLDRDLPSGRPDYQFTIVASDEVLKPNYGYASVSVRPVDVNDNSPQFVTDPLEGSVPETSPRGSSVMYIQAIDHDIGDNAAITFSIEGIVDGKDTDRARYFVIDPDSGLVTTNTDAANLDRETESMYRLTVVLTDRGAIPSTPTTGTVTINLLDIDDNPPIFKIKNYTTEMSENLLTGEVIRVIATDADIGDNALLSYTLRTEDTRFFSVQDINNQGSITVFTPVDYENPDQRSFTLVVTAQDNSGHKDSCTVHIDVIDFNDNAPDITPKVATQNVSEGADPGTPLTNFSATDRDSGINAQFQFFISRASDSKRQFSINPATGEVKTRRRLDRETVAVHVLIIHAIDRGSPAQTGTATLSVVVEDINDNYPTFAADYRPQVLENQANVNLLVQRILATDPDAPPFSAPFGFELTSCPGGVCPCKERPTCSQFDFSFNPSGDGGNGSAEIRTSNMFDREDQKYYLIPIIMWDMRGTGDSRAITGTNTLTVTIADVNDNDMKPGRQDIFVYNYKGSFGPVDIGRVYVEDPDDWDLDDKTFTMVGAPLVGKYFTVHNGTGMVTMQKGVPSSKPNTAYNFKVRVYDRKFGSTVVSTVSVVVADLSEEAVRNSGAVRLSGTSAEEFIKKSKSGESAADEFHRLLAAKLDTDSKNVEVISIQDTPDGFTDVRYSAHGSPYYPSSQTDSVVGLNKAEFEQKLGVTVEEVPIDACAEEEFEGGCYNYMNITGNPALVNANGTSFVGVEVFIQAREGCRATHFPEPNECSGDYCYHGGTCVKDDYGVLKCIDCLEGFDGPRCQQLRHSFDGKSYAPYPTLEQCEDSETSIEFITSQADGLLLYNGPLTELTDGEPTDFIALELRGGLPVLNIDHGSGIATLTLDGRDLNGNQIISSLSDGKWHKIDIIRKGKYVDMIVDDCQAAGASGSESVAPDTRPCQASAVTLGENSFLNVATLLYLGGRPSVPSYPPNVAVPGQKFNGCVRNLVHNTKIYDLHYKSVVGVSSGQNGCPLEDEICGSTCGENGVCTASFNPRQATCVCKPGWRGDSCSAATTVRDLGENSYIQWQVNPGVTFPGHQMAVELMYRTWDSDGILFTAASQANTKSMTLELKDKQLQVLYNLGAGQRRLLLDGVTASDGQWHTVQFHRVMSMATLQLDNGEGRNYASDRADTTDSVYMTLNDKSPIFAGAIVTNPQSAAVIDRDLSNTCMQDIRLNGQLIPIEAGENGLSQGGISQDVSHIRETNVKDDCPPITDVCNIPPRPQCPQNEVCVSLWGGAHICKCPSGFHLDDQSRCVSDCDLDPCLQASACSIDNGTVVCVCIPPWTGRLCNLMPGDEEKEPIVAIAGGTIAAIVAAIIVAILLVLLAFFLVAWYNRRKRGDEDDKFVVEDDADFDIRENVMFYDEEGAADEDTQAYDLTKLPNPIMSESTNRPLNDFPRRTEMPRARSAPDDRPDVGDVLHDRLRDADDDPEAPPHDTLMAFDVEGGGSDAGSLSSLGSSSSDTSQDYDYLNSWGPKFAKLADMYGAGGEAE